MNVIDAAHAVVHDYPGGSEPLAKRMGMAGAILRGKVNENDKGHHLTLVEAVRLQHLTGDHRIIQAEAEEMGYMLVHLPDCEDADFGQAAMRSIKEFGEFVGSCEESLRDGKVTKNEMRRIEKELLEALAHMSRLHQLISAKAAKR